MTEVPFLKLTHKIHGSKITQRWIKMIHFNKTSTCIQTHPTHKLQGSEKGDNSFISKTDGIHA